MKLALWGLLFGLSFALSFILIMTFSQEPFHQKVAARIIGLQPPPIAIYWYVLGAFVLGLCTGLAVAAYNYFSAIAKAHRKNRTIKELEGEVEQLRTTTSLPSPTADDDIEAIN